MSKRKSDSHYDEAPSPPDEAPPVAPEPDAVEPSEEVTVVSGLTVEEKARRYGIDASRFLGARAACRLSPTSDNVLQLELARQALSDRVSERRNNTTRRGPKVLGILLGPRRLF